MLRRALQVGRQQLREEEAEELVRLTTLFSRQMKEKFDHIQGEEGQR